MEKKRKRLAVSLTIGTIGIILLMSVIVAYVGFRQFTFVLEKSYNASAYDVAETVANFLNPDKFDQYLATGEPDEEYEWISELLDEVVKAHNCNFIYIGRNDETYSKTIYIYDSVNPELSFNRYPLGYVSDDVKDPNYKENLRHVWETGGRAEKYLYSYSESGAHTTAIMAICDSSGKVVGIINVEMPMTYLNRSRTAYVIAVALIALFLSVLVSLFCVWYLNRMIVKPVEEITSEAKRFAKGGKKPAKELHAEKNHYEIGDLALSLKKMEQDIERYTINLQKITAEKERIGAELNVATKIQADMLPRIFPPFPGRNEFDIYATMTPAKEVGGDFYDFFLLDDDHLAMVMADVSGKGVPAALFMVIAKTLIKTRAQMGGSPAEILYDVNEQLCEGNDAGFFVTVWLTILEISTGKGMAANAGHEHPALRRGNGQFELIKYKHSIALGTMNGISFREHEFQMEPGDCLYVYTDGVTEATDSKNELFGEERMVAALNQQNLENPKKLLENVKTSIDTFVGEAVQFDDITMLAFTYYGKQTP